MGCNYYRRSNICGECNRFEQEHIGKLSAGWEFVFNKTSTVESFAKWKEQLNNENIFNEHGEHVTLELFLSIIADSRNKPHGSSPRLNHYEWLSYKYGPKVLIRTFMDEDGWAFIDSEFS